MPLATAHLPVNSPRMTAKPEGSFRLFQFSGITVYLHWVWLLVAYWQIFERKGAYSSIGWNVAEYLALFGIVLLHEFGHSFATRQVGGTADTILLWPFGGVAYVNAPQRPGAELWSIAAGPLVNAVLIIPLTILAVVKGIALFDMRTSLPDPETFIWMLWWINTTLLIFNLFPIYPLDGGQILRSLLWFVVGPIRSLLYASIVGFIGVGAIVLYAIERRSLWMGIMAVYIFMGCRNGFLRARAAQAQGSLS